MEPHRDCHAVVRFHLNDGRSFPTDLDRHLTGQGGLAVGTHHVGLPGVRCAGQFVLPRVERNPRFYTPTGVEPRDVSRCSAAIRPAISAKRHNVFGKASSPSEESAWPLAVAPGHRIDPPAACGACGAERECCTPTRCESLGGHTREDARGFARRLRPPAAPSQLTP